MTWPLSTTLAPSPWLLGPVTLTFFLFLHAKLSPALVPWHLWFPLPGTLSSQIFVCLAPP